MNDTGIAEFLKSGGLWRGTLKVKTLKGGYLNDVLRVTTGETTYVFKRFSTAMTGTLFPNLPADEARALERLRGLGVAPELIGFWPQHSLLVYDYVAGMPGEGAVADVAKLIALKEQADADGFRRVSLDPAAILAEGDELFSRCRQPAQARFRPKVSDVQPPSRLSLIHTDIGASNLIGAGQGLRLIDWQCPAAGDICEDVYSFLSPAFRILSEQEPFTSDDVIDFLGALGRDDVPCRYDRLRPAYAWRMAGYCAWRSEVLTDAVVCDRYRVAAAAELSTLEGHA